MKTKTQQKKVKEKNESATKKKKKYRVRNWKEYNEALVNRGRIIFHITEEALKQWEEAEQEKKKKRGRPKKFSDTAIETALTLGQTLHLPLRGTERTFRISSTKSCGNGHVSFQNHLYRQGTGENL